MVKKQHTDDNEMRIKKLQRSVPIDRRDFILSVCAGKKVLDLGCADYPMTETRCKNGDLLFAQICDVAEKAVGVDISLEGIQLLRSHGFGNVVLGDIAEIGKCGFKEPFDVIVAGEIIEHVHNIGGFFQGIKTLMKESAILVITVPNAHALKRFLRVLFGREMVNKDHVCYYSQANIELLCNRYGLRIDQSYYYLAKLDGWLKNILFSPLRLMVKYVFPYVSDHLMFVCKLAPQGEAKSQTESKVLAGAIPSPG